MMRNAEMMNDSSLSFSDPAMDGLVSRLRTRGWRCASAESCTGGGLGERLTRQAGSSEWFEGGVVVYSNAAKTALLGVAKAVIEESGAVSEAVAGAMAAGLLTRCAAQTTAAITGIAGPDGGTQDKPVGTVVFAWAAQDHQPEVHRRQFSGDRIQIRAQAVEYAVLGWAEYLDSLAR